MNSISRRPPNSEQLELIQQFSTVIGCGCDSAHRLLRIYNWNLELAITKYIDEQSKPVDVSNDANLVDKTFWPRKRPRSVNETPDCKDGYKNRDGFSNGSHEGPINKKRRKNLDEIYGPPLELMPRSYFESARKYGQETNRWLMVNIQNSSEFSCHVLNRDVWRDPVVKSLIQEHFVLWQDNVDSPGGSRFMQFYDPVVEFPYLAVIDPRTGDKLMEWHGMNSTTELCGLVNDFLEVYGSLRASVFLSKLNFFYQLELEDENLKKSSSSKSSQVDKSEDGKLIKATSSNSGLLDQSKDRYTEIRNNEYMQMGGHWKDCLGSENDSKTDLLLLFPDGRREQITWPCSTKLISLPLYVTELGFEFGKYELLTNFPRKNLLRLNMLKTLKEVGLFPRELIIIHLKT